MADRPINRPCPACLKHRTLYPIYMPPGVLYVCLPCKGRIEEAQRARAAE